MAETTKSRARAKVAPKSRAARTAGAGNPLLGPWRTPFGVAPFDRIEARHFAPAFQKAMKEHLGEVRAIAANEARPSFANTIRALEKSGALLTRVSEVFFNLTATDADAHMQALERDIAPAMAAHQSRILLDAKLFRRVADLYDRRDRLKLDAEEARILERTYVAFVRAGAKLGGKAKKRVAAIQARLAALTTAFSQNVLADEQSWHLVLESERDLAGLPEALVEPARRTAESLGRPGKHAITLSRSSAEPFLQYSARRDLREKVYEAWVRRGENGGRTDNSAIVAEIVALRAELARLMEFDTFAAFSLDDTMAKEPSAVMDLLTSVWPKAVARAQEERKSLEARIAAEGGNHGVAAWDWRYFAERERKARYDIEDAEVRLYLSLDNMIAAAFDTASRLFDLVFEERHDVPRYHADVRVWEVRNKAGRHVGLFLGDYFARPTKRSGAWMSSFRSQHKLGRDVRPIIVNVLNFSRGSEGEAALLSFDDARTLFHEFGHALHGLLSDVVYPSLSGTSVSRDFVELPSQLYEHWLMRPEILKRFALHHKTGKPMPDQLIKRLAAARTFNQGFHTVEYVASAIVDMELHTKSGAEFIDIAAFEREVLSRIGMPREIAMRHRIPHFGHIMGGYAAGYYSYLWSEVMDADAFGAFEESGDVFDKKLAGRLKLHIYAAGNRRDPREAYIAFRGRMPDPEALLRKRGFPV